MLGRTLLIIDDEKHCRNALAKYFIAEQFTARTAATADEGIQLAEELRPDFILLDYHLQGDSATRVCAHIRSSKALKKTFIVIISGDETMREASYAECQADHFVLKCIPNSTIREIFRSFERRDGWNRGTIEKGDIRLEAASFQVFLNSKPLVQLSEERFALFSLLVENSPCFVKEDAIIMRVYNTILPREKVTALGMLFYRLKQDLGIELAGRIQNHRCAGWAYLPPSHQDPVTR